MEGFPFLDFSIYQTWLNIVISWGTLKQYLCQVLLTKIFIKLTGVQPGHREFCSPDNSDMLPMLRKTGLKDHIRSLEKPHIAQLNQNLKKMGKTEVLIFVKTLW